MMDFEKYLNFRFNYAGQEVEIVGVFDCYEGLLVNYIYTNDPEKEIHQFNVYHPEAALFLDNLTTQWNIFDRNSEQVVGIGEQNTQTKEAIYHYPFVCPHCKHAQTIHTNLQSRYGDLGGYYCANKQCNHEFHCTTDDGGCSCPKLYVYDNGHLIATLELPQSKEKVEPTNIIEGAYTSKNFHTTQLINDGLYIELGYFDTRKGRIYAIGYDYPNRNEDYFEFYRITEEQWRYYKVRPCKQMSKTECAQWYMDNLTGLQILCNDFSPKTPAYKPYFTDDEL